MAKTDAALKYILLFNWSFSVKYFIIKKTSLPPTSLLQANYEKIAGAFGCQGYLARTIEEVQKSVQSALAEKTRPSIINVFIEPSSGRVQQVCLFDLK